jgi:hypothetical protein
MRGFIRFFQLQFFVAGVLLASTASADHLEVGTDLNVTGVVERIQIDLPNGTSKTIYKLRGAHGNTHSHDLKLPIAFSALEGGAVVRVSGQASDKNTIVARTVEVLEPAITPVVTGPRSAAVVLLNFTDKAITCTPSVVEEVFFSTSKPSVDSVYRQTSGGRVSFTGQVFGPITINYLSTGACDLTAWASAANAALTAQGVNLSSFTNMVYSMPSAPNCTFAGLGFMPGTVAWTKSCSSESVGLFSHELGHNFGMAHASTGTLTTNSSEYGDESDFMGRWGGVKQVNAPHREQMGWIESSAIQTISSNATVEIAPLELDPTLTAGRPQIIKIQKLDTNEWYYLSYRRPIGYDATLPAANLDRLSIHRYRGWGSINTFFLSGLTDGASFLDSQNKITVTAISHTSGYVTVRVEFSGTPPLPTPSNFRVLGSTAGEPPNMASKYS